MKAQQSKKQLRFFLLSFMIFGMSTIFHGQEYLRSYSLNSLSGGDALTLSFPASTFGAEYEVTTELIYSKALRTDVIGTSFLAAVSFKLGYPSDDAVLLSSGNLVVNYVSGERSKERSKRAFTATSPDLVLTMLNIEKPNGAIPDDVYLNVSVKLKNHDKLKYNTSDYSLNFISYDDDRKLLMTSHNFYAEEYEFEWVYVDKFALNELKPTTTAEYHESASAFELYQGISIRLQEPFYDFDPILPEGKVYFRVRPILKHPNSEGDILGNWRYHVAVGGALSVLNITSERAFEKDKNWSYQRTYAENGLEKTVVSYSDALGNNRQLKTDLTTDENIIIAETFYDYEGRASTSPLPFPMSRAEAMSGNRNALSYLAKANVYEDGTRDKANYDRKEGSGPLSQLAGAAKYFSSNNDVGGIHRDAIPNANGYVVSQTHYKKDHTGRPVEAGGIGETFSLTKNGTESHTSQMFYLEPTKEELASLFGSNTGDAKRYRKEIVIDGNGQASISYRNAAGQVIATALAGASPDNLMALESNVDKPSQFKTITNDDDSEGNISITSQSLMNISGAQVVDFIYEFTGDNDQLTEDVCYGCAYDLTIEIISPSGEKLLLAYQDLEGNDLESEIITREYEGIDLFTCTDWEKDIIEFSAYFGEIGQYNITKTLTARDIKIEEIVDGLKADDGTLADELTGGELPTRDEIRADIEANTDFTVCIQDCDRRCEALVLADLDLTEETAVGNAAYETAVENCQNLNCDASQYTNFANLMSCERLIEDMASQYEEGAVYFGQHPRQDYSSDNGDIEATMEAILEEERILLADNEVFGFDLLTGSDLEENFWSYTSNLKSEWTRTLAENHHPEIRHYELCQLKAEVLEDDNDPTIKNVYSFDSYGQAMANVETFEEAVRLGFVDPLLMSDHEDHVIKEYLNDDVTHEYLVGGEIVNTPDPLISDLLLDALECRSSHSNGDSRTYFRNRFDDYSKNLESYNDQTGEEQANGLSVESIWTIFEAGNGFLETPTSDETWVMFRSSYLDFREKQYEVMKDYPCVSSSLYLDEDYAVVKQISNSDFDGQTEEVAGRLDNINNLNAEYAALNLADDLLEDCDSYQNLNTTDSNDPTYELTTAQEDIREIVAGHLESYLRRTVDRNPLQVVLSEDIESDESLMALEDYMLNDLGCSGLEEIAFTALYTEVCTDVELPDAFINNACNDSYRLARLTDMWKLLLDHAYSLLPNKSDVVDLSSSDPIAVQVLDIAQEINLTIEGHSVNSNNKIYVDFDYGINSFGEAPQTLVFRIDPENGSTFATGYNWINTTSSNININFVNGLFIIETGTSSRVLANTTVSAPTDGSCDAPLTEVCYQTLNEDCGCAEKIVDNINLLSVGSSVGITQGCDCNQNITNMVAAYNEMLTFFDNEISNHSFSSNYLFTDDLDILVNASDFFGDQSFSHTDLEIDLYKSTGHREPSSVDIGFFLGEVDGGDFSVSALTYYEDGYLGIQEIKVRGTNPTYLLNDDFFVLDENFLAGNFLLSLERIELVQPLEFYSSSSLGSNYVKIKYHFRDKTIEGGWFKTGDCDNAAPVEVQAAACSNLGYNTLSHDPLNPNYLTVEKENDLDPNVPSSFDLYFYDELGFPLDPTQIITTYSVFHEEESPVVPTPSEHYSGRGLEIDYLDGNGEEKSGFFYLYASKEGEAFFNTCYFPEIVTTVTDEEIEAECVASIETAIDIEVEKQLTDEITDLITDLINEKESDCISGVEEQLTYKMNEKQYHYTLYYYDQSGNLVQTVPPEGVDEIEVDGDDDFETIRLSTGEDIERYTGVEPNHSLATYYTYNNVGHLLTSSTPDGGDMHYWYDDKFRIRLSQNAQQVKESSDIADNNQYAYTKYDDLGRPIESGELLDLEDENATLLASVITHSGSEIDQADNLATAYALLNVPDFPDKKTDEITDYTFKEVTQTIYTDSYGDFGITQNNTRNRVTAAIHKDSKDDDDASVMFYSYDIHGNVEDYWSYVDGLGLTNVNYEFDLISGNVLKVNYNEGKVDQFFHKYIYDADNRLTAVKTSSDDAYYYEDVHYYYYAYGPLARVELGDQGVQGCDYYYNLQGWLKGVNTPDNLGAEGSTQTDLGFDGMISTLGGKQNKNIAKDEFAMALAYYKGDYESIGGINLGASNNALWEEHSLGTNLYNSEEIPGKTYGLYNGNISAMIHQVHRLGELKNDEVGSSDDYAANFGMRAQIFSYDQLQRLKIARSYEDYSGGYWAARAEGSTAPYDANYAYDANGNITTLQRWGQNGILIDDLAYEYKKIDDQDENSKLLHNRLLSVHDYAGKKEANDLSENAGEFTYDKIGNLITQGEVDEFGDLIDLTDEEFLEVEWRLDGKVESIHTKERVIEFKYDALGNRVRKYDDGQDGGISSYYVRDASGNSMANYRSHKTHQPGTPLTSFDLTERPIYGTSRHGLNKEQIQVKELSYPYAEIVLDPVIVNSYYSGDRAYEESNHLGNVMVVVLDQKNGIDIDSDGEVDFYESHIASANDYYPYGWGIADRSYSSSDYRYGYQGSEKDDEVSGNGNSYTTYFRRLDPRLGKWFSVDPVVQPWQSPYTSMDGNPIRFNDPNGDCPDCPPGTSEGQYKHHVETETTQAYPSGYVSKTKIHSDWYWHEGSTTELVDNGDGSYTETTYSAGWYTPSDYKEILTGTSSNAVRSVPLNGRTLIQDVIGSKSPITEKDLSVDELLALRDIVQKVRAKGKSVIEYADYATTDGDPYKDVAGNNSGGGYGEGNSIKEKGADPYYALKTTLGQATIVVEDGVVYVVDTYDFNDARSVQSGKTKIELVKSFTEGAKKAQSNPDPAKKVYSHARNVGSHLGSADGEGIPVKIRIPLVK